MGEKKVIPVVPILLGGALAGWVCYNLIHILTPFIISLAFAYVMNPAITHLESRGLRRDPIVLVLYLAAAAFLTLAATSLLPVVATEWEELQTAAPGYISEAEKFLGTLPQRLAQKVPQASKQIEKWTRDLYDPMLVQFRHLPSYLLGLFPILSLFILVPFITFFLLVDGNRTIAALIQACPSRYVEQALYLMSEIDTSLGRYLRGLIIESLVVGVLALAGLLAIGVDHAVAIAILAALSAFVPYVGALFGALVGAAAALYQTGELVAPLQVIVLFAGVRFIDDWFLQPMICKHSVQLHPLAFLLSLMVGAQLFGIMGLVIAVPAAAVVKSLFKVGWDWYSTEVQAEDMAHVDVGVAPYT